MNRPDGGHARSGAVASVAPESDEGLAATADTDTPERRRVRLFVAAHVGAVSLVYLLAAWVGDGWAPPPFPPDISAAQRQALLADKTARLAPAPALPADLAPALATIPVQPAPDVAAPWRADRDGQAMPPPDRP